MTCVLLVAGQVPAERPRDGAECRDQDDGGEPEDAEPGEDRLHEVRGDPEEGEDPDADRDAAEDADDVIDRRVVGPLLVPVVEPLEAQEKEPAGDREQECHDLEARSDSVARRAARDKRAGKSEGEDEPHDVGDEQAAPNESASPIPLPPDGQLDGLLLERCANEIRNVRTDAPALDSEAFAHTLSPLRRSPRGRRPPPFTHSPSPPCRARLNVTRSPNILAWEETASARRSGSRRRACAHGRCRRRGLVHRKRLRPLFATSHALRSLGGSINASRWTLSTVSSARMLNLGWSHARSVPGIRSVVWAAV